MKINKYRLDHNNIHHMQTGDIQIVEAGCVSLAIEIYEAWLADCGIAFQPADISCELIGE